MITPPVIVTAIIYARLCSAPSFAGSIVHSKSMPKVMIFKTTQITALDIAPRTVAKIEINAIFPCLFMVPIPVLIFVMPLWFVFQRNLCRQRPEILCITDLVNFVSNH